jgi:hypothetical protein
MGSRAATEKPNITRHGGQAGDTEARRLRGEILWGQNQKQHQSWTQRKPESTGKRPAKIFAAWHESDCQQSRVNLLYDPHIRRPVKIFTAN